MSELDDIYQSLMTEKKEENDFSIKDAIKIIKQYAWYLWNKKIIIIIVGVLGGLIGLTYVWLKPITYTAQYSFTVASSSPTGGMSSMLSLLGAGGSGSMDAFSGDNVIELLKSPSILRTTLMMPTVVDGDTVTFIEYKLIVDSVRAKCMNGKAPKVKEGQVSICDISYPLGLKQEDFTRVQDSLMNEVIENMGEKITVSKRDKKLAFIDFSFSYEDEEFAKRFSNAMLKAASELYVNTKTQLSRVNVDLFQSRADSIKYELNNAMTRRAIYLDENRNASGLFISSQAQKIELDVQVLMTAYSEVIKSVETLKLDLVRQTPLIQIVDTPYSPLPNDKMRKLKGLIIGGFLGGFLVCSLLCLIYFIKSMQEREKGKEE